MLDGSDEDEKKNPFDSESEPEMFDNKLEQSIHQAHMSLDEDHSDFDVAVESEDETPIKKKPAPAKRKLGPKISDDEDDSPVKPVKKQQKRKQLSSDEDTPKKVGS